MKRISTFTLLILATSIFVAAQIPQASNPTLVIEYCPHCGAIDHEKGESHRSDCPYYYGSQQESEKPKPVTTTPTPKPKPTVSTPKPASSSPSSSRKTPKAYSQLTAIEKLWRDVYESQKDDYVSAEDSKTRTDGVMGYSVVNFKNRGDRGLWKNTHNYQTTWYDYDNNLHPGEWLYQPHYQHIEMLGKTRAALQLKTGKWGAENIEKRQTIVDYEYDEIKSVKTYGDESFPHFFVNRKEPNGHNNWYAVNDDTIDLSVVYEEADIKRAPDGFNAIVKERADVATNPHPGKYTIWSSNHQKSFYDLESVKQTEYNYYDLSGRNPDDGRVYHGIVDGQLNTIIPPVYDRINIMADHYQLIANGKMGIALREKPAGQYFSTITMAVPAEYDVAKIVNTNRTKYALVGNNDKYAFYSLRHKVQMLPEIFTPNEVQSIVKTCTGEYGGLANDAYNAEGTGSFKQYVIANAINAYRDLNNGNITADRVRETEMSMDNLKQDYLFRQQLNYESEARLGKYDKKAGTYTIKTHWGVTTVTVPEAEAKAFKEAWKRQDEDFAHKAWLDLDANNNVVLRGIAVLSDGKVYGITQP